MGWSGHKINKNGDRLFVRGGIEGFSGAYLKIGKLEVKIEYPEIFDAISNDAYANKLRLVIENMDTRELLKRVVILPEEGRK